MATLEIFENIVGAEAARRCMVASIVSLMVLGCTSDDGGTGPGQQAPVPADVSGTWAFSITNLAAGGVTCGLIGSTVTLQQTGSTFAGSLVGGTLWCRDSQGQSAVTFSANVINGTINGDEVAFDLQVPEQHQVGTVSGDNMNGTSLWMVDFGAPIGIVNFTGQWAASRGTPPPPPQPPPQPTRFTDIQAFLTATGASETVSFPSTRPLTTAPYVENGVTLMSAGGFNNIILDETATLSGNEFTVSGAENIDITFPPGVFDVGLIMEDGSVNGGGCTGRDSQFQLTFVAEDMQTVLGVFTEDPPIGQSFFIGFVLGGSVGRLEIREVGSDVNDLFDPWCEKDWIGSVYTGTTPPG